MRVKRKSYPQNLHQDYLLDSYLWSNYGMQLKKKMTTCIHNKFRLHKAVYGKELRSKPPICFIPSITSSICSNERTSSLYIYITIQGKKKYFLFNPIGSGESYIKMLISYDSILAKKGYPMGAVLKESEMHKVKEVIDNNDMMLKDDKTNLQEFHQECDKLIKSVMSLFKKFIVSEVYPK